jgi:hypothetical protein
MAYATLEEVMQEMGVLEEGINTDLLQAKIDAAQDIVENVTHRCFEADADETRLIDYSEETVDGRTLHLPYDICQIAEVLNGDGEEVTVNEYVTTPRLRTVSSGSSVMPAVRDAWPWYALTIKSSVSKAWTYEDDREEAISITGRWAFSVTPPAAIKAATIRLAHWLYMQKDDLRDREESEVSQDGILLLMGDLPNDVQARLLPFVRL